MFNRSLLIASLFAIVLPLCTHAEEHTSNLTPRIKIGVIAPITGGVATWGQSVSTAITLANEHAGSPVEVIIQDESTCDAAKALTAYTYLRTVKKVDVVIASCLEGAQAIGPLARRDKVPYFISGRSTHDFQRRNPNALSWLSLLDYEGEAIVRFAKAHQWTRGAAMVWNAYFGLQFAEGIKAAAKTDYPSFAFQIEEVSPDATPSGSDVQRLLRSNPQAIFLMLAEGPAAFVVKQLRALNYTGAIVLQSSLLQTYDPAVRAGFRGALQQKFVIDPVRFETLRREIAQRLNADVSDDFVFSYDGFTAVLTELQTCASEKTNSLEHCLTTHLRNEQWRTGASGRFRVMTDGSTERSMIFRRVTDTGFEDGVVP